MTSTTSNVVSIKQHLPEPMMGRSRVGFSINLGEIGMRRFLSNLPEGQASYYESRANDLKEPVVEVVMPDFFENTFDLSEPEKAISEMQAMSRHHHLNTTTYILDRVAMAVAAQA